MSGKKYQIFISSTFTDLKEARETITKSILDMYHIPIGMEMFSADNNEQWDTIKATIENSDFYVLIIGHRYGSIAKKGISYTEKEHDYAKEIGVPILTFIRDRGASTTPEQRDKEAFKKKKLESFISKVSSDAMINYWTDQTDLALKITIALNKAFGKYKRIGWIRTDEGISPKVSEEIAALSKENRELKDRIRELENSRISRLPFFEVLINNNLDIEQKFIEESELANTSSYFLKTITGVPHDVQRYINTSTLNRYNEYIKNNEVVINDYNRKVILYERYKSTQEIISFQLKNTGKLKATNIVLEAEFPEELYISANKSDIPNIDLIKPNNLPSNPIDQAWETKRRFDQRDSHIWGFDLGYTRDEKFERKYSIEGNCLKAKFNHILHTQMDVTDEIFLTPLERGSFEIDYKIICEEFDKPQVGRIKINII